MVFSAYYNKVNNVITVSKATNKEVTKTINEENKTFLFNEEELIGLNVFNPKGEYVNGLNDIQKVIESENLSITPASNPFVVGFVKECIKHPKSEKLSVCQIDIEEDVVQIVCGAQNIESGQKVIVAKVGAVMPNGMNILPSKLLDEPSFGMVCSYGELNKEQKEKGIAVLGDEYKVGQSYL